MSKGTFSQMSRMSLFGAGEPGGGYGGQFGRHTSNLRGLSADGKIRIHSNSGSKLRLVSGGVRSNKAALQANYNSQERKRLMIQTIDAKNKQPRMKSQEGRILLNE